MLQSTAGEIRTKIKKLASFEDVADLLEIPPSFLRTILYGLKERLNYTTFEIPKRSGKARVIQAPPKNLKILQEKLNSILSLVYKPKACVHGFTNGRSVKTNACNHLARSQILNIDLADFFGHVHIGRIIGSLSAEPFSIPIEPVTAIAQVACNADGVLPQGSPCSPILSNIVAHGLDVNLIALAKKNHLKYTRYADDISLSTTKPRFPEKLARVEDGRTTLGSDLTDVIENAGFRVNMEKVRLRNRRHRQEVTGITVNEFPNVRRSFVRQIRAAIHAWRKHGYEAAEREFNRRMGSDPDLVGVYVFSLARHVRGKLAYLEMVRGRDDPIVRRLLKDLHELDSNLIRAPRSLDAIDSSPLRGSFARVPGWEKWFRRYRDSVIFLKVEMKNGDSGVGTGFKIADDLLATAGHNMIHGDICALLSDGESIQLEKVDFRDVKLGQDVGLLRIPRDHPVSARPLLSQARLPEVGEQIAAIGYPSHITRHSTLSINIGTVESLPLSLTGCRFLQLSFLSGGGLSGGPVIDCRGFVVGIVLGNLAPQPDQESESARSFGQAMPFEYLQDLRRKFTSGGSARPTICEGRE